MIKNSIVYNEDIDRYDLYRGKSPSVCRVSGGYMFSCNSDCPLFDLKKGNTGQCREGDNPIPTFYTLKLRCAASIEPYIIRIEDSEYKET